MRSKIGVCGFLFSSKNKVAGRDLHKVLAENTTRSKQHRCGDFPDKPNGPDLGKVFKPLTTFAMKKNQLPI